MQKFYIPSDRKHISSEAQELFESVKREIPSFSAFSYGLSIFDDEYFFLEGHFACAKLLFERGTPHIIIKKDVRKSGFLFGVKKFDLRTQFAEARKTLRSILGLSNNFTFDTLSRAQEAIIANFKKELAGQIADEKIVKNTRLSFYSLYDEQFSPFWFVIDENGKLIFKHKNIAPLNIEKEGTIIEIEKNEQSFKDALYKAKLIINSLELYYEFSKSKIFQTLLNLPKAHRLIECEKPYVLQNTVIYELLDGKTPVSIEIRKNDNVLTIVPKIGKKDKGYFDFSEVGLKKAFNILSPSKDPGVGETISPPVEEPKEKISQKGREFLEIWRNLPLQPSVEEVQFVCDWLDEVPDEDFKNPEIKQAYEKLSNYLIVKDDKDSIINVISTRSIYVRESHTKYFKNNDFVEEVIENMRTLPMVDLLKFFKDRRLVYIDGFWKIRISNTRKERIVFVTGDKIGKNKNDIYIYEFNENHEFKHLKNADPNIAKYELLTKNVKLNENQAALAESFHVPYKPLICTGCAGSGKTLISVEMYKNIVEEIFSGKSVNELELIYLTYNKKTLNSVRPLILEKAKSANAKTIEKYFKGIVGSDALLGKTIVNEEKFFDWWSNDNLSYITDFKKKNALLDYKRKNLARYAYTFFRGFFKGSLYKMQITFKEPHLSKMQFSDLIRSKNEPVSTNELDIMYELFVLYQKYLYKNNFVDDNDLARMVSTKVANGIANQYQRIIVDEVQDLTEVQLDAIIKSSYDKRKLYFFGDQNQSINPTLFDISTIQRCLMANLVNEIVEPHKMNKSYRVGPLLADYINSLTNIINKKIGSSGDPLETSALTTDDSKWGYKTKSPQDADIILSQAFNDAESIVIVPDNKTKEKLVEKYGEAVEDRAITIYESKGLEWDKVVLYNMLSFNNKKFEEILTNKAYNSTLHRMIFNQYYVGCTRAHVFFVVIESNVSDIVEQTILDKLIDAPHNVISADNSSESWLRQGQRLFNFGEYKLAQNCLLRAKDNNATKLAEVCSWMLDKKYTNDNAKYCKENKLYKEAKHIYEEIGNIRLARLMDAYLGSALNESEIKNLLLNETLNEEDIAILNKGGFIDNTMEFINNSLTKIKEIL